MPYDTNCGYRYFPWLVKTLLDVNVKSTYIFLPKCVIHLNRKWACCKAIGSNIAFISKISKKIKMMGVQGFLQNKKGDKDELDK